MDSHSDKYWGIAVGACLGAFAAYLLTTPEGRRMCDAAVKLLEDFSYEVSRFGHAAGRAQAAVADGWKAVENTFDASKNPTAH